MTGSEMVMATEPSDTVMRDTAQALYRLVDKANPIRLQRLLSALDELRADLAEMKADPYQGASGTAPTRQVAYQAEHVIRVLDGETTAASWFDEDLSEQGRVAAQARREEARKTLKAERGAAVDRITIHDPGGNL